LFQTHCFFCGKEASAEKERKKEKKYRLIIHEVASIDFKDTVIAQAIKRNDEWGEVVRARVETVNDLRAADAKFHHSCSREFFRKGNAVGASST